MVERGPTATLHPLHVCCTTCHKSVYRSWRTALCAALYSLVQYLSAPGFPPFGPIELGIAVYLGPKRFIQLICLKSMLDFSSVQTIPLHQSDHRVSAFLGTQWP